MRAIEPKHLAMAIGLAGTAGVIGGISAAGAEYRDETVLRVVAAGSVASGLYMSALPSWTYLRLPPGTSNVPAITAHGASAIAGTALAAGAWAGWQLGHLGAE